MKNKIIKIIILGFMTFCCVLFNAPFVASASASAPSIPKIPTGILENNSTVVVAKPDRVGTVYMLVSNKEGLDVVISGSDASIVIGKDGNKVTCDRFIVKNGEWAYERQANYIPGAYDNTYQLPTVYYTTKPIYKQDSSTNLPIPTSEVVFQQTSRLNQTLVGGVTVEPILQTILGLIKLLIPLLVGWVALRKALALLSRILHQA